MSKRSIEGPAAYIRDVASRSREHIAELHREIEEQGRLIQSLEAELLRERQRADQASDGMSEREELKLVVAAQKEELALLHQKLDRLKQELESTRDRQQEWQQRIRETETRRNQLESQHSLIEQQNNNLTTLYVASYQLQQVASREEVLGIIQEVVVNLIGCEELAVFLPDGASPRTLRAAQSMGLQPDQTAPVSYGEGIIGGVAAGGKPFISDDDDTVRATPREQGLTACVPLTMQGEVLGVVAAFGLLEQKQNGLTAVDRELLELLSTHAGSALYYTGLQEQPRESGDASSN